MQETLPNHEKRSLSLQSTTMSLSTAHNFMQFGQSSSSKQNICVRCNSFQIYIINIKPQRLPIDIRNAFKILLRHVHSGTIECLTSGFRSLIRTTSSLSKDFKSCSSPYTRIQKNVLEMLGRSCLG